MSPRLAFRAISALLLFLTVWFLWPRELDGFSVGRDGRGFVPDYAMTNARYVSVRNGKVELESRSRDAAYDLFARRMDAQEVTSLFYNDQQQATEVKSDRATFFLDERRVHLQDNVRSRSPDGFVLRGPEASYFMDRRFLVAPRPVEGELESDNMRVWGNSAESRIDDRKVHLVGDARAEFMDRRRGLTRIRGDRALLERDHELVTFQHNVRVNQEKVVGTSESAQLFYAGKERGLKYMSLTDDVRIREGNRRTRSQVAEFFAPTDTIVLTGFPSVYHGDDVVTGDRITLYRATGVVEVTATNAATPQGRADGAVRPRALTREDDELIP